MHAFPPAAPLSGAAATPASMLPPAAPASASAADVAPPALLATVDDSVRQGQDLGQRGDASEAETG